MPDRKIRRIVENDPAAASELSRLIEQSFADARLARDYRDRPPIDAPHVIRLSWSVVAYAVASWAALGLAVYAACVALGLAG